MLVLSLTLCSSQHRCACVSLWSNNPWHHPASNCSESIRCLDCHNGVERCSPPCRYCECFRANVYCGDACRCLDCHNVPLFSSLVLATRASIQARNPSAFAPRIVHSAALAAASPHLPEGSPTLALPDSPFEPSHSASTVVSAVPCSAAPVSRGPSLIPPCRVSAHRRAVHTSLRVRLRWVRSLALHEETHQTHTIHANYPRV